MHFVSFVVDFTRSIEPRSHEEQVPTSLVTVFFLKLRHWGIPGGGPVGTLVGGACYLYSWHVESKVCTADQITRMFEPVTSKYGINIVCEIGPDFLPPTINAGIPTGPGIKSKVVPMEHWVLARYPDIFQAALRKYPIKVINDNLKAIYFAKKIKEEGFRYGGSHDPFRHFIYLANNGRQNDVSSVATFHHEFSSLLLRRHSFLLNPWLDQNPKQFEYLCDDKTFTFENTGEKNNRLRIGTDRDYEKGFMNIYAKTSFENDFNEYAAMIFTYPQKFKKIMNQHPRVRGKFLIFQDFYQKSESATRELYEKGIWPDRSVDHTQTKGGAIDKIKAKLKSVILGKVVERAETNVGSLIQWLITIAEADAVDTRAEDLSDQTAEKKISEYIKCLPHGSLGEIRGDRLE